MVAIGGRDMNWGAKWAGNKFMGMDVKLRFELGLGPNS